MLGVSPQSAVAASFTCAILDGVTGQPRSVFNPGNEVAINVTLRDDTHLLDGVVRFRGRLTAKVAGIKVSTPIPNLSAIAPDAATRGMTPGWTELDKDIRKKLPVDNTYSFTLPENMPDVRANVVLIAQLGDPVVQTLSCRKRIRIVQGF